MTCRQLSIGLLFSLLVINGCKDSSSPTAADAPTPSAADGTAKAGQLSVGLMPKLVGIDYFNAVENGAKEAAKELGIKLTYDGPVQGDAVKQGEMIDTWVSQGMDVIAVSPNDPNSIAPALKAAQQKGIKVITYDADAQEDSRSCFVNQATNESVGFGLVDIMAEQIGGGGEVAIVTGSMTAANQNIWMDWMRKRIAEKYPEMKIVGVRPSEVDFELGVQVSQDLMKAHPNLKGIFGITSVALPAAARAVKDAGKSGQIAVTGLSSPHTMKEFVDNGTVREFLLWNPTDLGYLTIYTAKAVKEAEKLGATIKAGRLGDIQVSGTEVLLGPPIRFNKNNIDKFDF